MLLDHIGLNVKDLEQSIRFYHDWFELEIVAGLKPQRDGETILFRDPSGNILEVCYPSLTEWSSSK